MGWPYRRICAEEHEVGVPFVFVLLLSFQIPFLVNHLAHVLDDEGPAFNVIRRKEAPALLLAGVEDLRQKVCACACVQ